MSRKSIDVTISEKNRDHGKTFVLTEMPASQAEKWAARALMALARSNVEFDADLKSRGVAGIATLAVKALMRMHFEDAEPLMDEAFKCVQIRPDAKNPQIVRPLIEEDIEEISTRVKLRVELFDLHTGFFLTEFLSTSISQFQQSPSPDTQTSQDSSQS